MTDNAQAKPAQQFQRKTILIKKTLQYRYMGLIFVSVLIGFLIIGLEILWTVTKVVNEHPMMMPLLDDLSAYGPIFLLKMVVYMIIVLIAALLVSHRMAGPIYKFEKSCATVAAGDLTHRVYLRKGDQLIDLQEHFNNMTGAVNEVVKQLENFKKEAAARDHSLKDKAEETDKKIAEIMPGYKI